MAIQHLQRLAGHRRSRRINRQLGAILAFVAGATNAGGFLAVRRYTSHMTGIISAIADDLATGGIGLAGAGLALLLAFMAGAACTALLVNWGRRRQLHGAYALALMVEAALLLGFGVLGANLASFAHLVVPATVLLLCFIMGLQNAIITKISQAEIRTTHMTGVVTDLGLELGRLLYWNRSPEANAVHVVRANRDKLFIHATVLGLFFLGGLIGAQGFKHFGFAATLPLACLLLLLATPALLVDLRRLLRAHR